MENVLPLDNLDSVTMQDISSRIQQFFVAYNNNIIIIKDVSWKIMYKILNSWNINLINEKYMCGTL